MSTAPRAAGNQIPGRQYVAAEHVVDQMADSGVHRVRTLNPLQILLLAMLAGAFVTVGALFSVLLSAGVSSPGVERLLEGLGFSAGFFFVILADAVLFTEANVVLPATLLRCRRSSPVVRVLRFWALAWLGNLIGAFLVGWAVHLAQEYPADVTNHLSDIIERKLAYRETGGPSSWGQVVLSGVLANWLVGMAAFFAVMGRTIIGKYVPVFLAVTLFVAANFQHSPANMGFFALVMPTGEGPGWATALAWSIVPAGIGNVIGGTLLVALPFWYVMTPAQRRRLSIPPPEGPSTNGPPGNGPA